MLRKFGALTAALAIMFVSTHAIAHGGGGGGGGGHGGGGHGGGYYYVPIYGGTAPAVVPAARVGDTSGIKTVAIISSVGEKVTLGVTALFALHKDIDVSDWKLDDTIESTVAQYLSSKFTIKNVPHDPAALAAISNNHFDTDSAKSVQDYLAALPSQGVDAFVVIRADSEGEAPPTGGLSVDSGGGFFVHPAEVANYEFDMVDAHTFKVISHAFSRIQLRGGTGASFAALNAPVEVASLDAKSVPTDAQRAKMKTEFTKLMALSLLETIRSLNLGVPLPDVGGRIIAPTPAGKAVLPKVKTVAVVSAIGDSFGVIEMDPWGAIAHENFVPVADWQIDSRVEGAMRAALSKRFVVKDAAADRAQLSQARINFTAGADNGPLPGLQVSKDIDMYLVALKHAAPYNSPRCMGLGVYGSKGLFSSNATAYACYDFVLVDGRTLKPVFAAFGTLSPKWPVVVPMQPVDGALWPKTPELSPEQNDKLRAILTSYLDDSVPEMMLRLGLTDMTINYIPGVKADSEETSAVATAPAAGDSGAQGSPATAPKQ